jgi:hypothetical protein
MCRHLTLGLGGEEKKKTRESRGSETKQNKTKQNDAKEFSQRHTTKRKREKRSNGIFRRRRESFVIVALAFVPLVCCAPRLDDGPAAAPEKDAPADAPCVIPK